jgi:cytochrome c oxidase assembly protein subunit 15
VLSHRIACITAAATLALILVGGLVTNSGSALAVPDWPTTYGYNMFLYPWSRMVGGILYEHSHRLLGSLVGLLTVTLALVLWLTEPRRWVRALGGLAVVMVMTQGVLGGLRVVLVKDAIAIFHGCLAQAFFALTVGIAVFTSRRWREGPPAAVGGRLRAFALAAVGLLYVQIVFGALLTHAGVIDLHLIGAAAVFTFVPMVTARARATGARALARPAALLLALLLVQLGLGVGAYLARFSSVAIPGGEAMVLALPVAHRLVAAMILGSALALALALLRARRAPAPDAAETVRRDFSPLTVETAR